MKRLHIVEQAMKLQRNWQTRACSVGKAYAQFNTEFASLKHFAMEDPCQGIHCSYIWELSLQLEASR